ncbi:MAG: ParB/RepB/Spo0J family partition protein [Hyphomicrobiales bacterium]
MADAEQRKDSGQKRLGRGLAALIGEIHTEEAGALEAARNQRRVPIEFLAPNPKNPRKAFAQEDLRDLSSSIKERGIFQPIIVRPDPSGEQNRYEIIAGERRWRAAQMAGLHEIPVLIHKVSDKESLEIAIIENVQRADLNAIEEALGYDQLAQEYNYSQAELADVIGKSRSHVANMVRLLKLPSSVRSYIAEGKLTAGHARTLITAKDPEVLAEQIVQGGLTVRNAEALSATSAGRQPAGSAKPEKDADTRALEERLTNHLGLIVSVDGKGSGERGEVRIRYKTLEQLDEIIKLLQA